MNNLDNLVGKPLSEIRNIEIPRITGVDIFSGLIEKTISVTDYKDIMINGKFKSILMEYLDNNPKIANRIITKVTELSMDIVIEVE